MASTVFAVWRARPGGSNTNGGGYDASLTPAATGTHGSLSGGTFTDATAAAFTSAMVGRSLLLINNATLAQYKILGFIDASNIKLGVTGTGGAASGTTAFTDAANLFTAAMVGQYIYITGGGLTTGYYLVSAFVGVGQLTLASSPGTGSAATWTIGVSSTAGWTSSQAPAMAGGAVWKVGAGTDYSQQDAAAFTGSNGATTGTTNFQDATFAAFTAAMIGNAIYITGTGQTTGIYWIKAVVNASNVTLDVSPGTGTGATWAIGGAWADPWTRTLNGTTGPAVPVNSSNIVYVLGSGTPNPAAYVYDYTYSAAAQTFKSGAVTFGKTILTTDPGTPGFKYPPDTTGGMATIKVTAAGFLSGLAYVRVMGLWLVHSGTGSVFTAGSMSDFIGCVYDQLADNQFLSAGGAYVLGCELFSSVGGVASASGALVPGAGGYTIRDCNIHNCISDGIRSPASGLRFTVSQTIIAKCGGNGITVGANDSMALLNSTIDGNVGNGLALVGYIADAPIISNIFSNHTGVGKAGINITAQPNLMAFADFNAFYNNTLDVVNMSYGPHDTFGGSNPYVGQATENYTLA